MESSETARKTRFPLWMQILLGLVIGVGVGYFWPAIGAPLQPIGTASIRS